MTRPQNPWTTILLCLGVMVLEGFDIQVLGVAMPRLAPELGLTPSDKGWVMGISSFGLVFGSPIGGWLADRYGRKRVLLWAVASFALATLATSQVHGFQSLLLARFAAGLGFGAAFPNMMAIAAEVSPPGKRIFTTSAMFCGMPFGGGTSALLTQLLPPDFDWRILFVIGGVLPLVLWPLLKAFLQETLPVHEAPPPVRMPVAKVVFGGGRAWPSLLLWLGFLPTMLVLYLILNWLPTLVEAKGFSKIVAPQASLAFNYASVVGALVLGALVDRVGPRWAMSLAYVAVIAGAHALGAATQMSSVLWISGLIGFFLMGANYALYGVAASHYPAIIRGTGSGVAVGVGRFGSVIGPLVPGLLLQAGMTANDVIFLMVPAAAVAGLAVFAVSFFAPAKD